ncbi:MAG: c-type cytochrome [Sulfuriferula sp.]
MSDDHAKMTKTTPQQFFFALWGGLFAPLFAILLIVALVAKIQGSHSNEESMAYNDVAVTERIQPVGELALADPNAVHIDKSGAEVYAAVCIGCHASGALGAPKYENKGDWSSRIAQGYDTLIKHALEGIRQMPARGGNPDLTDTEIANAVAYMANSAGAKFTPPAAPAAATPAAAAPVAKDAAAEPAADTKKI